MHKLLLGILLVSTQVLCAQQEAITTISTIVLDETVQIDQKDKKTHTQLLQFELQDKLWEQFERIDAVFLSSWTGTGQQGLELYEADRARMGDADMEPLLHFAEKDPRTFTRPERVRNNYGIEQAYFEVSADEKCMLKYRKKKMAPRWFYGCLVTRSVTVSPVDFIYKQALPRKYYSQEKPAFQLLLRSSSKEDTVVVHVKVALTIKGLRRAAPDTPAEPISRYQFLKDALSEGMKAEGFPLADAEMILNQGGQFFVGKCPICAPVEAGIRNYVQNYEEKESTAPNDLILGLSKDNREDQHKAFSQIINHYVQQHYKRLGWNDTQIAEMQSELEAGRKTGMGRKSDSFGKFCPSCDGACGRKPGE